MTKWKDGAPVLPVQLSEGVTATKVGIVLEDLHLVHWLTAGTDAIAEGLTHYDSGWLIKWPDAAERLQYHKGEPWCYPSFLHSKDIQCVSQNESESGNSSYVPILHRLAAILCDGADEFRVLYWCIHNLREQKEAENE